MGLAQTKVTWEDPATGNDEEVLIRLSTNVPNKDIVYSWSDGKKFQPLSAASKEVKQAISKSGLAEIDKELRDRIARETQNNPKLNSSDITDDLLVQALNTLSQWRGKKFTWTDKGGKAIESKKTPNPNPTPKNKKETVMVSGIKADQYGEITVYKIGYDKQCVAKAVSYDKNGSAQEEKNFAQFIGDNFKARTEKDPDYMDNLGSKEIVIKLKRFCSDPSITWYSGDLSRKELIDNVEADKKAYDMKKKEREEYDKKHKPSRTKRFFKGLGDALGAFAR